VGWAEFVRSSAPFATRSSLFAFHERRLPLGGADVGGGRPGLHRNERRGRAFDDAQCGKVFRVGADAAAIGAPIFDDPQWNSIEATPVAARAEPNGHTSAVMPGAPHGTLLCLNVNDGSEPCRRREPGSCR
jgi:hypothetical protein